MIRLLPVGVVMCDRLGSAGLAFSDLSVALR